MWWRWRKGMETKAKVLLGQNNPSSSPTRQIYVVVFCLVTRGQSNFSSLIRVSPWHTVLFLMVAHEHTLDVFGGTALADSWLFSSHLLPPPLRSHTIFFSFFWLPANEAASLNSPVIPSLYFLRSASAPLMRRLAVADLCAPLAHILLASRWLVKGCDNLRKRPQRVHIRTCVLHSRLKGSGRGLLKSKWTHYLEKKHWIYFVNVN